MTQLCWDMEQFKYWLDTDPQGRCYNAGRCRESCRSWIMAATINMALSRNGCVMDRELCRLISKYWLFPNPFAAKSIQTASRLICSMIESQEIQRRAGIEYTIRQIDEYRALGVDGIHLYALNKWKDVSEIIDSIRTCVL